MQFLLTIDTVNRPEQKCNQAERDGWFNPLNAELNPICHLLALLGAHHILHLSRIRVKECLHGCMSLHATCVQRGAHLRENVGT
jgi:hypothetical protein